MSGSSTPFTVFKRFQQTLFKTVPTPGQDHGKEEHTKLLKEALKKMSITEPLPSRVQFIREFCEFVKTYK